jgi:hypothetical protein
MKFPHPIQALVLMLLGCVVLPRVGAEPDASLHLYLLVGQSNMAGRGAVDEESKKIDPRILMLTKELQWQPAADPLHFDKPVAGVGPGLAFAKSIAEKSPGIRIGLIPCAVGGTSIKLWVPEGFDKFTKTRPYADMLERVKVAQREGVLKGIIWHQGEADRNATDAYAGLLSELIERMRTDCGAEVPFVAGEISSFQSQTEDLTLRLNAAIHSLEGRVKRYGWVSSEGLNHKGDQIHYDSASARILGVRFADKIVTIAH